MEAIGQCRHETHHPDGGVSYSRLRRRLPLRRNEAAGGGRAGGINLAEAVRAAIIPRAADRTAIPTVDRTLMGRVVMSTDLVVISSSEVVSTVSTTHSGDRSTAWIFPTDGMDIRMGIRTGRTTIRRTSRRRKD